MSAPKIRIVLLAISAVTAVAVGFFAFAPLTAISVVQYAGYYLVLAGVVAFGAALFRFLRNRKEALRFTAADLRLILISVVVALLWQAHGPRGFKILMDELVLNTTAMSMHFDREAFVPLKTHEVNGMYTNLGGLVDKRPLLFPFIVSLLHDVTGYRPENVFFLNAVLSAALLFAAGRVARQLGGTEGASMLCVILLAGVPLLSSNATGAGFELLNLVMLCGVMFLAIVHLRDPREDSLDALALGTVLLAQARYESALFVGACGAVVAWGWWQQRRLTISWGLIAAPLLLILVPLQRNVFVVAKGYWQLNEQTSAPFQLQFIPSNFGSAVRFLFSVDGVQLASPVLSACGVICLLFFLVYTARRIRTVTGDAATFVLLSFGAVVLANFGLLLCYHWGRLDDYMASRLGLPLLLLFALASAFVIGRWVKTPRIWGAVLSVPVAWGLIGAVPVSAQAESTETFLAFREARWERELVRTNSSARVLYALPSPLAAILERKPAIAIAALAERAEQVAYHLEKQTYQEVLVFQRLELDPTTGIFSPVKDSRLGPEFILETIEERHFLPFYAARLSRLVRVDLSRADPRPPDWKPSFPPFELNISEGDVSPTQRYLAEFLRNLP